MGEPLSDGSMFHNSILAACQETDFVGFSFLNHTAEIIEAPTVLLRAYKREAESIRIEDLFANYFAFCVDTVWAKRGEHLKSHMKNSCDCYHGARFSGILAECVHLIGFSRHSSAQQERKHCAGGKTSEERNGNTGPSVLLKKLLISYYVLRLSLHIKRKRSSF